MIENKVYTREATNKERIIVVEREGEEFILNSAVDPEYASEVYAEAYSQNLDEYNTVFIFGISDGRVLQKIIDYVPQNISLIIYEPEEKIYQVAKDNFQIRELEKKKNIYIFGEKKAEYNMRAFLGGFINFYNFSHIRYMSLPNYKKIFPTEWEAFKEALSYLGKSALILKGTTIWFREEWCESGMLSMRNAVDGHDVYQIKKEMQKQNITDVPAIIVCAGPSLDKNIEELKKAEGRAFVIVVDASLRAAQEHGILPDITISVDGRAPENFFETTDMSRVPIVLCPQSNPMLWKKQEVKKFMTKTTTAVIDKIDMDILNRTNEGIDGGGSVSTYAYALAVYLGFKTIIFIGQDLSYPGGKRYYDNLALSGEQYRESIEKIEQEERCEVEDIYGEMVPTNTELKWYRDWLEMTAEDAPEVHIIDATEGGARIKCTEVMTLKDAISQECKKEIDFKNMLREIPEKYSKEQKKMVIEYLNKEPDRLHAVQDELREVILNYDKMISLVEEGLENEPEFKEYYQRVSKMRYFEDKEPTAGLLRFYNLEQIYEKDIDIYNTEHDVKEILINAQNTVQGYVRAIDLYLEDYQKFVLSTL